MTVQVPESGKLDSVMEAIAVLKVTVTPGKLASVWEAGLTSMSVGPRLLMVINELSAEIKVAFPAVSEAAPGSA